MAQLSISDIADLREYERIRDSFRRSIIALKRLRRISIGPVVTVVFESIETIRFQIQEMARAERMMTDEAIQGEIDAYSSLIPDVGELSLTLFIELTSDAELREWLPKLVGIERAVTLRISSGNDEIVIRNEVDPAHESQLTRDEITASVHYVHFLLTPEQQAEFAKSTVKIGIEHSAYAYETVLSEETKASLVSDWKTT